MARKSSPVLPGQSRSAACRRTTTEGRCGRLAGHKGACRPTLLQAQSAKPTEVTVGSIITLADGTKCRVVEVHPVVAAKSSRTARRTSSRAQSGGVEVHSADRYTVQPEPRTAKRRAARKAAPVQQCRVRKDEVRCDRAYGHKAQGLRHRFTGRVTVLPEAGANGRDVQTLRPARRSRYVESGQPSRRLA